MLRSPLLRLVRPSMLFSSRVVSKRVGLPMALSEGRLKRLNILWVYQGNGQVGMLRGLSDLCLGISTQLVAAVPHKGLTSAGVQYNRVGGGAVVTFTQASWTGKHCACEGHSSVDNTPATGLVLRSTCKGGDWAL
jgi:hypothetical protein